LALANKKTKKKRMYALLGKEPGQYGTRSKYRTLIASGCKDISPFEVNNFITIPKPSVNNSVTVPKPFVNNFVTVPKHAVIESQKSTRKTVSDQNIEKINTMLHSLISKKTLINIDKIAADEAMLRSQGFTNAAHAAKGTKTSATYLLTFMEECTSALTAALDVTTRWGNATTLTSDLNEERVTQVSDVNTKLNTVNTQIGQYNSWCAYYKGLLGAINQEGSTTTTTDPGTTTTTDPGTTTAKTEQEAKDADTAAQKAAEEAPAAPSPVDTAAEAKAKKTKERIKFLKNLSYGLIAWGAFMLIVGFVLVSKRSLPGESNSKALGGILVFMGIIFITMSSLYAANVGGIQEKLFV
jgi:hypothetical protein